MLIRADKMGQVVWCVGLGFALIACGGDSPDSPDGSGGLATMSGGVTTTGGTQQTGGMTVTGGTQQAGGMADTGGTTETGGAAETGGSTIGGDRFDSDNAARNEVSAGAVCDRLSTLQCAGEEHCCDSPGRTFEECKATVLSDCIDVVFLDVISAEPATGFSATRAKAVLGEFESLSKACDPSVGTWGASGEGLGSMMRGTRADGDNCHPGLTVKASRAAAALASCAMPASNVCLPTAAGTWRCAPRGDVGASCFTDANCMAGMYCPQEDYLTPDWGQACATRLADEESCISNNECQSYACRDGACVAATTQSAYCIL